MEIVYEACLKVVGTCFPISFASVSPQRKLLVLQAYYLDLFCVLLLFFWAGVGEQVSLIRNYHNHTLQTNPQHRQKETQNTNSHKTSGRQLK